MSELYLNPTVKKVIFQITYPNLLLIEKLIGDFQFEIMDKFPDSNVMYRRHLLFANIGLNDSFDNLPIDKEEKTNKIWQFTCPDKYQLNVLTNSLDISSDYYKTYKNTNVEDRFRDIIEFVVDKFFNKIPIPLVKRIGLRYIDECPLPKTMTNIGLHKMYNSVFPLDRFSLRDAAALHFSTTVKKDKYNLVYTERLKNDGDGAAQYTLDFDGFALNVRSENIMSVTDDLYNIISEEYERTIKEPVRNIMRKTVINK